MKKIWFTALVTALLTTISVPAVAAELNNGSKDVTATYHEGTASDVIYSVDVSWGSMEFTYTAPDQGTWNPQTHNFDNPGTTGIWSCDRDANKITITNHTNAPVSVELIYEAEDNYGTIAGEFDQKELELVTAVGTIVTEAPTESSYLSLTGEFTTSEDSVKIGEITVVLKK